MTINNLNSANLNEIVSSFNSTNGLNGVNASIKADGTKVSLVITSADGRSTSIAVEVPELDEPEGAVDVKAASEKLLAQMESIAKTISVGGAQGAAVHKSARVFFDMFVALALLVKITNMQSQLAAEIKMQQHQEIQKSLMAQAQSILDAASTAFTLGMISAVISSISTVGSFVLLGASVYKTHNAAKQSGISDAQANLDAAEHNVKQMQNQLDLANKADQLGQVELSDGKKVGDAYGPDSEIGLAGKEYNDAQTKYDQVKNDLEAKKTEVAKLQGDYEKASTDKKAEVKTALDKAEGELKQLEADLKSAEGVRNTKAAAYKNALEEEATKLENELAHAKQGMKGAKTKDEKQLAENQKKDIEAKLKYFKAFKKYENAAMETPEMKLEDAKLKLEQAREEFKGMAALFQTMGNYKLAQTCESFSNALGQLSQSCSRFLDVFIQDAKSESEAEIKRLDAQQEGMRAQIDAMSGLRDDAQKLIDAIVALLKELIEIEQQSNQQAIRV